MKTRIIKISQLLAGAAILMVTACGGPEKQQNQAGSPPIVADNMSKKKVLVILSANHELEVTKGQRINTGFFLDEFAVPAQALVAAGYELEIATPGGAVPTLDSRSVDASYFHNDTAAFDRALNFVKQQPYLAKPLSLKTVAADGIDQYRAIFVPGGRAPMTDLMQDPDLGKILNTAHRNGQVTALICHGPVALVAALPDAAKYRAALVAHNEEAIRDLSKDWIYKGYRMTIFSNSEEDDALKDEKYRLLFYVQDALRLAGGKTSQAKINWDPYIVRDRELITGQNPGSDHALADTLLKVLAQR